MKKLIKSRQAKQRLSYILKKYGVSDLVKKEIYEALDKNSITIGKDLISRDKTREKFNEYDFYIDIDWEAVLDEVPPFEKELE